MGTIIILVPRSYVAPFPVFCVAGIARAFKKAAAVNIAALQAVIGIFPFAVFTDFFAFSITNVICANYVA